MSITTTETRVQITSTAGQTVYTIPFQFDENAEIVAYYTLDGATPDDTADI